MPTTTPSYIPPAPVVPPANPPTPPFNPNPVSSSTGPFSFSPATSTTPATINSQTAAPATPNPLPSTNAASPQPALGGAIPTNQQAEDIVRKSLEANPVSAPQNHPGFNPNTNLPNPVTPPAPAAPLSAYDRTIAQIGGLNSTLATKGTVTTDLQNTYGLDQKTQDATTTYNNYQSASLALSQKLEAMRTSPGGLSGSRATEIDQASKAGNANLANLAIIAQAASGNLQAAQNIIKSKLDAQFQPIQDQVNNLTKYAELNNANLSDADKAQIELRKTQLQNNLDLLKGAMTSAHQFALTQGITNPAVLNAIDSAKTPAEAYQAVGMNSDGSSTNNSGSSSSSTSNLSQVARQYVDTSADGTQFVSQDRLNNLTPYQRQQVSAEYAKSGVRVLQSGEVSALNTLDQAGEDLKLFEKASNNLLSSGLLGRAKGLTTNQLAQVFQTNPEWRQFQALRSGLIKSVQGIAAGAPGLRVTGAELANAADALPNSTDNLESSQQAVQTFRQLLDVNKNVLLRKSASSSNSTSGSNSSNPFADSNFYGK